MSDATPKTTADVLSRLDQAWASPRGHLGGLSPTQLTDVRDPAGWAVKDHVMHVAAWEDAFVARLEGRPTHEALGLDEATLAMDEDAENAAIFARHRDRPLADVLDAAPGQPSSGAGPARRPHRSRRRRHGRGRRAPRRGETMAVPRRRGSRATRGSTTTPTTTGSAPWSIGGERGARGRIAAGSSSGLRGGVAAGAAAEGGRRAGRQIHLVDVEDRGDHPVVARERHELDQALAAELGLGARELVGGEPRGRDRSRGPYRR